MAISSNPLIGATRQSVGGITFSSWKGLNVIKTKPQVVANPNTAGQKAQRNAFGGVCKFYAKHKAILGEHLRQEAKQMTMQNVFSSWNMKQFDAVTGKLKTTGIPLLKLSTGSLASFSGLGVTAATGATATLKGVVSVSPSAWDSTCVVCAIVYNETRDAFFKVHGVAGATVMIPSVPAFGSVGEKIHVFMLAHNVNNSKISTAQYAGVCTLIA